MKILFYLCLLLLLCLFWQPSNLKADTLWDHNGSEVRLEAHKNALIITYQSPRKSLNVNEGELLFTGRKNENAIEGTAYRFSTQCGKIAYPVKGSISSDEQTITLYGKAPRRDNNCNITAYFDDTLKFKFLAQSSSRGKNIDSTTSPNNNFDTIARKYLEREKTLLEQVANYTISSELNGAVPYGFWLEISNCTVKEFFFTLPGKEFNFNNLDWNNVAIRFSYYDEYKKKRIYKIGDGQQDMTIADNAVEDRLVKAWSLARQQCPGKRMPF